MESDYFTSDQPSGNLENTRYRVLQKLYEISEGDSRIPRRLEELETTLGLSEV